MPLGLGAVVTEAVRDSRGSRLAAGLDPVTERAVQVRGELLSDDCPDDVTAGERYRDELELRGMGLLFFEVADH
jgi:hypothetical protein